jgi:hypothetical protein
MDSIYCMGETKPVEADIIGEIIIEGTMIL